MENKEYTLQDAKEHIASKYAVKFISGQYAWGSGYTLIDELCELYKTKATEELRKEKDELKFQINLAEIEIERLTQSNKELVEALRQENESHNSVYRLMISGESRGVEKCERSGFNKGIEALEKSLIARGFNKEDYNGVIIFEEIEKLKKPI